MKPPSTVTASEIAAWVYCPEQWRLEALGLDADNEDEREGGWPRHRQIAAERKAGGCAVMAAALFVMFCLLNGDRPGAATGAPEPVVMGGHDE